MQDLTQNEMRHCSDDYTLVIKHRTNTFVCVSNITADKLAQRGWGTIIESENEPVETLSDIQESQNEPFFPLKPKF